LKLLRDYIINEIKTRVPDLKTVRSWNNQFDRSNNENEDNNDEQAFDYPACFVELSTEEVKNVALGIKYVSLIVRLHLGFEGYSKERPQDYTILDTIDASITGMRGGEGDTVQFSSLVESDTFLDTDFDNVNNPILEYTTVWTKKTAYNRSGLATKVAPTGLDIIEEII